MKPTSRIAFVAIALVITSCQQQMAQQPAYRPLTASTFFLDGRSARPQVEGTIARGELYLGSYFTGRTEPSDLAPHQAAALLAAPLAVSVHLSVNEPAYLGAFPFTSEQLAPMLRRGQGRFDIFCSPCHDRAGTGRGMIVERGYVPPPSLHTDLSRGFRLKQRDVPLRSAPVGYLFEVITQGFGAMPDYAAQIPPEDRWAIVAYVRALQFSQNATLDDVDDPRARLDLLKRQEGTP